VAHRLRLDSRTVEVELMALETGSHELLAEQWSGATIGKRFGNKNNTATRF
jgi:hypothetical protein